MAVVVKRRATAFRAHCWCILSLPAEESWPPPLLLLPQLLLPQLLLPQLLPQLLLLLLLLLRLFFPSTPPQLLVDVDGRRGHDGAGWRELLVQKKRTSLLSTYQQQHHQRTQQRRRVE